MEGSSQQCFDVDKKEPDTPVASITGPDPAVRKQRALMGAATALLLIALVVFGFGGKTPSLSKETRVPSSASVSTVHETMSKLATRPFAHAFVISSLGINAATRLRGRADTALPQKGNRHRNQPFSVIEMSLVGKAEEVVERKMAGKTGDSLHRTRSNIPRRAVLAGALGASSIGSLPAVAASETASDADTGSTRWPLTGPLQDSVGAGAGLLVGLLARDQLKGGKGLGAMMNKAKNVQNVVMNKAPEITESSSERAIRLAEDLSSLDAKLYGAFWCPPCHEQKQILGKEAMQRIDSIECDSEGLNSQHAICQKREVPGFPTWEIGGILFPGSKSIDELEDIVKMVGSAGDLVKGGDASGVVMNKAKNVQSVVTNKAPEITEHSSTRAIRLAEDLTSLDAKLYGAFWCPPCHEQKQLLGKEAMERITCIECDSEGVNSQHVFCQEREVAGFPTWEIGGILYPGSKSMEELEDIVQVMRFGLSI